MTYPTKAKSAPDQRNALFTNNDSILPDFPAAGKLPAFAIEVLPTPLREPASVVQILVRFDVKRHLPGDWAAQVLSVISRAKNRALTADCMTPGARAFWECPHD